MANYPTSLDTLTNPTSGNTLDNPSHSLQHSDANDILEALETKLGIGASPAGSATSGHALVASTGGTTSWTTIGTAGISSGAASNGQVLTANGSGGVSYTSLSTSGLVLLNTTSFSAVASQSVNNVFTSSYENYLLVINYVNATTSSLRLRLRVSGTDATGATDYGTGGFYVVSNSSTITGDAENGSSFICGSATNTIESSAAVVTILAPQNANRRTLFTSFNSYYNNTNFVTSHYSGGHKQLVSYDGFTLFQASGGTITGSVSTYGFNK